MKYNEKQIEKLATGREELIYPKKLTEEEVQILEHALIKKRMVFLKEQQEFAAVKAQFNQVKKAFLAYESRLLDSIHTGEEAVREEVTLIPDFKDQMMRYVNRDGEIVHSRPLNQGEKQLSLLADEEDVMPEPLPDL